MQAVFAPVVTQSLVPTILGGAIVLLLIGWLLARSVAIYRKKMVDSGLAFALTFVVSVLLWWAALRSESHAFWGLLATGWTLNWLGNAAWGIHEYLFGHSLRVFSWIDAFYMGRYILVFGVLWGHSGQWAAAGWWRLVGVLLLASAIGWLRVYRAAQGRRRATASDFLGSALYPILDITLIYAGFLTWICSKSTTLGNSVFILTLSMVAYGTANWINFGVRMVYLKTVSSAADLFWVVADVLMGLAALRAL
jgi:hypothetical protein